MTSGQDDVSKTVNHNEKVSNMQEQAEDSKKFDNASPLHLNAQEKVEHNAEVNDPNYEGVNLTTEYYQEHGHR